jgi:threonine dehydrogenase-like Zn-dependent dehydrogenase
MRAITVSPGCADSARLEEVSEPPAGDGAVLVRTLLLGVCGTDREIVAGAHGSSSPGRERMILGHESLGEVLEAPHGILAPGDLVVGIVRRPDPVPCPACAAGEWDMCRNGRYTERGIKERDGFGAERFRIEPEFAVKVDPSLGARAVLLEPASILAKAWQHVERIGARVRVWQAGSVLVTGAGPIGLIAALMGAQRGLEVHVLDRNRGGPKQSLVEDLGATYHNDRGILGRLAPDIIIECTGASAVIRDCLGATAPAGVLCLTGVGAAGELHELDIAGLNRTLVLGNQVQLGTVNANREHYQLAAEALAQAEPAWLDRLITRRVPLERWSEALEHRSGDIKVVVDFEQ